MRNCLWCLILWFLLLWVCALSLVGFRPRQLVLAVESLPFTSAHSRLPTSCPGEFAFFPTLLFNTLLCLQREGNGNPGLNLFTCLSHARMSETVDSIKNWIVFHCLAKLLFLCICLANGMWYTLNCQFVLIYIPSGCCFFACMFLILCSESPDFENKTVFGLAPVCLQARNATAVCWHSNLSLPFSIHQPQRCAIYNHFMELLPQFNS